MHGQPGPNSSTGTITMAAVLQDKNTPVGDLRGAKVTFCFVEGEGDNIVYKPIPSAKKLPAGLVNVLDGTVGAASADVQIDIRDIENVKIAVILSGGYYNEMETNPVATVTLAKPDVPDGTASGNGHLVNTDSDGMIKGALNEETSFSFEVGYNNKQTNPQGNITIELRSWYKPDGTLDGTLHTYVIESNAINLFAIGAESIPFLASNQAIFDTKANLSEKMDDGTVVSVSGNSPLHVTITDGDLAVVPVADEIGITYYRNDGGIWFSSNWNRSSLGQPGNPLTFDQQIAGGEITISVMEVEAETNSDNGKYKSAEIIQAMEQINLQVYPNPFTSRVQFRFASPENVQARIDIFDMTGRAIQTIFEGPVKGGVEYTAEFKPQSKISGIYLYRMTLGDAVFNGKVVYNK